MHNRKLWYGLAALAAAWLFDFLFWKHQGGISFVIWAIVLLGIGYTFSWREGKKPAAGSLVLTGLILFYSFFPAWRSEPMTRLLGIFMIMAGLLLLVATFLNGYWTQFRVLDYASEFGKTVWAGLSRGFTLFTQADAGTTESLPGADQRTHGRRIGSVLLGVVIAVPILVIFGLLLVSADPIFGNLVKKFFSIENLPEYIFRFIYILVVAYVLVGLYLHALLPPKPAEKPEVDKPALNPFLGAIEGNIVLGAVDLLFIVFVIVQVRYLFGGSANISETGYTYAEYARKGFGELVGVAVLSLCLYLIFNTITRRESKAARVGFSVLSVILIANVLVILASSLMRLLMYEDAYGFSELRTYTHVFIYWLAALLLAAIVLELVHRRGYFGLALLLTLVGYSATLGLMNVDGFVTAKNIARVSHGYGLDVEYLSTLSSDAVPTMVKAYLEPSQPQAVHDALGAELACRTKSLAVVQPAAWQDYRFGTALADQMIRSNQASWSQFVPTADTSNGWKVIMGTKTYSCYTFQSID